MEAPKPGKSGTITRKLGASAGVTLPKTRLVPGLPCTRTTGIDLAFRRRINEREPYLTRRRTSLIDGSEGGNAHSLRHAGARMKATENGRNQEQCHVGTDQNPSPPLPELLRPHAGIFSKNSRTAGARLAAICRFALLFRSETTYARKSPASNPAT